MRVWKESHSMSARNLCRSLRLEVLVGDEDEIAVLGEERADTNEVRRVVRLGVVVLRTLRVPKVEKKGSVDEILRSHLPIPRI
jgi:predicted NUDIX family phosphoesterase